MTVFDAVLGGASALLGYRGAKNQNRAARRAAQKQMDFQERMSSTAHQREIEDLRLAGLNPILSGTGGRGASSPGGAMNQEIDEIAPALSSAQQVLRAKSDLATAKLQRKNLTQQEGLTFEQAQQAGAQTRKLLIEGNLAAAQMPYELLKSNYYSSPAGQTQWKAQQYIGTASSALQAINPLRGLTRPRSTTGFRAGPNLTPRQNTSGSSASAQRNRNRINNALDGRNRGRR